MQTKTAQHTPLPWRIDLSANDPAKIVSVHEDHDEELTIAEISERSDDGEEEYANAELIVRAVNNHTAMLEALREAVSELNRWIANDSST